MRVLRWLALALGGLLALSVGFLLLGITISLGGFKDAIERSVSAALGQPVRVSQVSVRTGPTLTLFVSGAVVGDTGAPSLALGTAEVDVALFGLLRRHVNIGRVDLRGVSISVDQFDPSVTEGDEERSDPWAVAAPRSVIIEDLTFVGRGENLRVARLDVRRVADQVELEMDGQFAEQPLALAVSARLPFLIAEPGAMSAEAEAQLADAALDVQISDATLEGTATVQFNARPTQAAFMHLPLATGPETVAGRFKVAGLSPLVVEEYFIETGDGQHLAGNSAVVALEGPLDVSVALDRYEISVDSILDWLPQDTVDQAPEAADVIPRSFPLKLELTSGPGAVTYAGGVMQLDAVSVLVDRHRLTIDTAGEVSTRQGAEGAIDLDANVRLDEPCTPFKLDLQVLDWMSGRRFQGLVLRQVGAVDLRQSGCLDELVALRAWPLGTLSVSNVDVSVLDTQGRESRLVIEEAGLETTAALTTLSLAGQLDEYPLTVHASIPGPPRLHRDVVSYDAAVRLGQSTLGMQGQVVRPADGSGIAISGPVQFEMARFGGITVATDLTLSRPLIELRDFSLTTAAGQITGSGRSEVADGIESNVVTLRSEVIDADRLETLTAQLEQEFLDTPSDTERINWLEADFSLLREWLEIPLLVFDLQADEIRGFELPVSDLAVQGKLGAQRIDSADISVRVDDTLLDGALTADFSTQRAELHVDADIRDFDLGDWVGRLDIGDRFDGSADQVRLSVDAAGENMQSFLSSVLVTLTATAAELRFGIVDGVHRFALGLDNVSAEVAPDQPIRLAADVEVLGRVVSAQAVLPGVDELLDPGLSALRSKVAVEAESSQLDAEIVLALPLASRQVQISASGSGDSLHELVALGSESEPYAAPLGPYSFDGGLAYAPGQIDAHVERLAVGATLLRPSSLSWRRGARDRLDARVDAARIVVEDFWLEAPEGDDVAPDATTTGEPDPLGAALDRLLNGRLGQLANDNDAYVDLRTDELTYKGVEFGTGVFRGQVDERGLLMEEFSLQTENGRVHLDLDVVGDASGVSFNLTGDIDALDLDVLVESTDLLQVSEPAGRGYLFATAAVQGAAPDFEQMLSTLTGNIDIFVWPRGLDASELDIWVSNLLLTIIPLFGQNDSEFNCGIARLSIAEGIVTVDNLMADTTTMIVHGRGEADLNTEMVQMAFAPQSKEASFFSMETPVSISGPFDDIGINVGAVDIAFSMFRLYYNLLFVPIQKMRGRRAPANGMGICLQAMDWEDPAARPEMLQQLDIDFEELQRSR